MKTSFARRRRLQRGLSLTEVVVASALSTIVIFGALSVYLNGMKGWLRGAEMLNASISARQATRIASDQLREAMSVTVDADGKGLTYRLPVKDVNGDFTQPLTWDGITRRLYVSGGNLRVQAGASDRIVARNIQTSDTGGTNAAYVMFTPGAGSITRQVTVQFTVKANNDAKFKAISRNREVVYLRNIPELTQ